MFSGTFTLPARLFSIIAMTFALLIIAPFPLFALGDIWLEVEKIGTNEKFEQCRYCKRQFKTGNIHKDAEQIIRKQVQESLIERGIGLRNGKGPAQYINILVYRFEERKGGNYAVEKPAGVGFHMHLMDGNTVGRVFVFDEDQLALSQNVLNFGKFLKRGGKWVTADQLSEEGIRTGLDYILEVME